MWVSLLHSALSVIPMCVCVCVCVPMPSAHGGTWSPFWVSLGQSRHIICPAGEERSTNLGGLQQNSEAVSVDETGACRIYVLLVGSCCRGKCAYLVVVAYSFLNALARTSPTQLQLTGTWRVRPIVRFKCVLRQFNIF